MPISGSVIGTLAFVGGPLYALNWHPNGAYLAVGVHRSANPVHQLMHTYQGDAHLQIWAVQAGARSMHVSHLIPHNGDCIWDLKWRPGSDCQIDTLAAALGSGHVVLYHPTFSQDDGSLNKRNDASAYTPLSPQPVPQVTLGGENSLQDAVRTVEWSPQGDKLATGSVHGLIELYRVAKSDKVVSCLDAQLIVRVRAHEGAISTIRWLDCNMLCSAGLDGTQRVRDVREAVTELEHVTDGPAWNLSLVNPEEKLIISGSDSGVLRISKLGALSDTGESSEMKKTRVSLASLRDLAITPYQGRRRAPTTALFLGGGEGKLVVGPLPLPLWLASGCAIRKTRFRPIFQWAAESTCDGAVVQEQESAMVQANVDESDKKQNILEGETKHVVSNANSVLYRVCHSPLALRLGKAIQTNSGSSRPNSKKGYPTIPAHDNLCAEKYDQRVAITRLAISSCGSIIASGNHAGFLTVLLVSDDMILGPCAASLSKANRKQLPAIVKPKRKIGRPKKGPKVKSVPKLTGDDTSVVPAVQIGRRESARRGKKSVGDGGRIRAVTRSKTRGKKLSRADQSVGETPVSVPLRIRIKPERNNFEGPPSTVAE